MSMNMAEAEQSMMEVTIENEHDRERELEPFGEPTMMCLDDVQYDSQGDDQDDGQDVGQDGGRDHGRDDGEDDGPDDGHAKRFKSEQRGPVHERCVHGEINEIWVPLDRSEVFFSIAQPYELEPLSRYFFREWSEAEHLFTSALEYADEIFDDWSPSRSLSIRNIGL